MAIDYDELRPDVKESQDDSLAKAEPARQAGTPGARPGESELIRWPNVLGDAADRWPKSFCFVACSRRVLVPSVRRGPAGFLLSEPAAVAPHAAVVMASVRRWEAGRASSPGSGLLSPLRLLDEPAAPAPSRAEIFLGNTQFESLAREVAVP
ncbi:hypothetical protein [Sinomonas terrae]|uniref:Uncharacterized protein n=1 Tax=Sinomonas terrae TaxID=2908838 RepID=A0ABS9U4D5_9MICC|nr:hypothetical protein [Sinomonas terrae]MCH6471515.1 hypothetical protein [Sinomonas terrae]